MPSIAEVLLNVQGHSESAQDAVRSVADEIRRVPSTHTTKFQATVTDLDAKLRTVDTELRRIDGKRVSPTIRANIDRLIADVTAARAYLDSLPDHKTVDLSVRAGIESQLARITSQMAALGLQANKWGDDLARAGQEAEQRIPRTVNIDLRATKQNLERDLNDAENTLRLFSGRADVQPEARLKIDRLLVDVMKARAVLDTLPDHKEVDLRTRAGIEQDLMGISRLVENIGQEAERGAQAFSQMGSAAGGAGGGGLGGLLDELGSLSPLIQGVGLVLLVALIPALGALVASLASAAAGVGAVGAAFIGALGPGVLFALDLVKRLTDAFQAMQLVQQAQQTSQRTSAQGSQEAAQNAEQEYIAAQAVARAQDNLRQAYENVTNARRAAAQNLQSAYHQEQDAVSQLGNAQQQLRQATIDGYRAIEDAVMRVRDAVLGLESAQLGMADARLRIDQAKQSLIDFRNQAGLTGQAFDQLFRRLGNVNIEQNPQVVERLLAQISQAGGLSADDALRLRQMVLDLAHAQLDATGSAINLAKAQNELTRSRQDELPYLQRGIAAYKPYNDAIKALADAEYNAQKAEQAWQLARQEGVNRNPQVVAAMKQLENAHIALADAEHRSALAAAFGPSSAQSAWEQANEALAKLTPTERQFVAALLDFVNTLHAVVQPATDLVFGALTRAIGTVQGMLAALSGDIRGMGQSMGDAIDSITGKMSTPHMMDNWHALTVAAGQLMKILGGRALPAFIELLTNLARAAMPELMRLMTLMSQWLEGLAGGTDNIKALQTWLQPFFNSLEAWLGLVGSAFNLILTFARTVGPYGDKLVTWLTGAFNAMNKWLGTKQGQATMRQFFAVILPMTIQLVSLLGKLGVTFLRSVQFMAPTITTVLRLLNTFLGVLNVILGVLNRLPTPIRTALGFVISLLGAFAAFNFLKVMFPRLVTAIVESFRPLLSIGSLIMRIGGWFLRFLGGPLEWIGNVIRGLVIPAIEFIGEAIAGLAAIIGAPVEVVVAAIAAIVAVTVLIITHWNQVKHALGDVWNWMKGAATDAAHWIAGAFNWAVGAVKDVINWVIGAWDWFANKWNATPLGSGIGVDTPLGHLGIGGVHLPTLPKLALGGIVDDATLAVVGEGAHQEAVLPLTDDVFGRLGDAIARKLGGRAGVGGIVQHNEFKISSPPGTNPDPAHTVSRIADGMRRRGLALVTPATA